MKPTITPSITNGQRMNQLVAPTSFITSTSRRRAKIESRIVLAISATDANRSSAARPGREDLHESGRRQDLVGVLLLVADLVDRGERRLTVAGRVARARAGRRCRRPCPGSSGTTRNVSGSGFSPSSLAPSANARGFFFAACLSAVLLRDEVDRLDVGGALDRGLQLRPLGGGRVVRDVDVDDDAVAHRVRGARRRLHDRDEHARARAP